MSTREERLASKADQRWSEISAAWKPIAKTPGYVVGIGVVATIVVLLPLAYLAMIGGVGYGLYWHATNNLRAFGAVRGGGSALMLVLLYILPMIVGVIVLGLLIKPIFAPGSAVSDESELKEFEELHLYNFVTNVCDAINAPPPRAIYVDCNINASVGLRRGWLSLFSPGDQVLVIGLPLVAGMTKRQFAGVLAHEFGHCAQGAGMRGTFMVQSMNTWLARAAFEPDRWDYAVRGALMSSEEGAGVLAAWFIGACVWLARLPLKVLCLLVAGCSAFMMRRMEYDADAYEAQFSGSKEFGRAFERLAVLGVAHPRAIEHARRMYTQDRTLPNNVPMLVGEMARRVSREDREAAIAEMMEDGAGVFSSHPSTKSRIEAVERAAFPGLYLDDEPARELFRDFDAAARRASRNLFVAILGPYVLDAKAVSLDEMFREGEKHEARGTAMDKYLGFAPPTWRPVFVGMTAVPEAESSREVVQRLKRARAALTQRAPAAREKTAQFSKANEECVNWEIVRSTMDAGFRVDFKSLKLPSTTREGVSRGISLAQEQMGDAAWAIDEAIDAASARIAAALCLLGIKGVERAIPDVVERRARAKALLAAQAAIRDIMPIAREIRVAVGVCNLCVNSATRESDVERVKKAVRPLSDQLRDRLDDARRRGGEAIDPFGEDGGSANVGSILVGISPGWRDIPEIIMGGETFVERFTAYSTRVNAALVELAQQTERQFAAAMKAEVAEGAA